MRRSKVLAQSNTNPRSETSVSVSQSATTHALALGYAPSPPPPARHAHSARLCLSCGKTLTCTKRCPACRGHRNLEIRLGAAFETGRTSSMKKNACQEAQMSHSLPITSGGRVIKSSTLLKSWNTTRPTHPPQPSGIAKLGRPNYRRGDLLKAAKKGRVGRVNDRTPRCLHEGQTNFQVCVAHSMVIQRKLLIAARKSPPKAKH